MKASKICALAICALLCVGTAWSQNSTMTPYSRYGYGMLNDNATSAQRAMGGVGYAMNSGRQINVMNPASYAAIDSLTFLFDMGVDVDFLWANENGAKEDNIGGGLDYVTMSFPLSKRIGASFGILPFSSTGYNFYSVIDNGTVSHQGTGDLSQLYVGAAYNPWGGIYAGFNFAYLFGTLTNDTYATTLTGTSTLFQRYMRVRDWRVDIGVQYSKNLPGDRRATIGFTYSPGKSLNGETYGTYYDTSSDTKPDTVGYTKLKGKYSLPATYGVGLNYQVGNRLMAELDFTYQPWKNVKYAEMENFERMQFDNRWKVAAGLQYTPMPRGSYWQRANYRIGAYYNHDYLMVMGNNVREIGASVGIGLPVAVFKSIINLTVEYKHRQATPNPLIKEKYLTLRLGINFNEMWFRKSKIY